MFSQASDGLCDVGDHTSQPRVAGIGIEPLVPDMTDLALRELHRWTKRDEPERSRIRLRDAPAERCDVIGARDDLGNEGEVRNVHADDAGQPTLAELGIDV